MNKSGSKHDEVGERNSHLLSSYNVPVLVEKANFRTRENMTRVGNKQGYLFLV